jgi:hypothetical protein
MRRQSVKRDGRPAPWRRLLGRLCLPLALLIPLTGCDSSGNGGKAEPPPPGGTPPTMCSTGSDTCPGTDSTVFAISHAFNDPANTVLFRITVPAWSPDAAWGDGNNGFFYQATVAGNQPDVRIYVPFNGMGVAGGRPQLPPFSFIVPVDVSAGAAATSLTIVACSSNSEFDEQGGPACAHQYWTDMYSPLPVPVVGDPPFTSASLDFANSQTTQIPNNGVYPGMLTIAPEEDLTDDQAQWLYDHMVFFDLNGDPYTNDIFDDASENHRSIGVLPIDEAAFLNPPGGSTYHTKYGSTAMITASALPNKQFFFYTKDDQATTMINVGAQAIYDRSASCPGWVNGVGSQASTCTSAAPVEPDSLPYIPPYAQVIPETDQGGNVTASANGVDAGTQEHRPISFFASSSSAKCADAVNPLAVETGSAYSPPNYVIDDVSAGIWGMTFPNGLYYVVPTGFGNCVDPTSGANHTPFCQGTKGYAAYVPHYTDENQTSGTLNGGSTASALVGSAVLADQYAITALVGSSENSLVWFDNCGYGYVYEETNLGARLTLPDFGNFPTLSYTVGNHFDSPVSFSKECCASDYVENTDPQSGQCRQDVTPCPLIPQQQLDNGYGLLVPGGGSAAEYQTNFSDEALVVYDATTGQQLFKLRLNETHGAAYACGDQQPSVAIAGSDKDFSVNIGPIGTGSLTCAAIGSCPFGATASVDGQTTTCTVENSGFLLGVPEWAEALEQSVAQVQIRAWGAKGHEGKLAAGAGGDPGGGGFALTVLTPADLTDNLYAYIGRFSSSYGSGGSSTVLTSTPLSSLSAPSSADPAASGVLLIAGSGGGGGEAGISNGGNGGNGGKAFANANPPDGTAVNGAGGDGHKGDSTEDVGHGGNKNGDGAGGSEGGNNGLGGLGGKGDGDNPVAWNDSGSLIPPSGYGAGEGGSDSIAGGGGGYGGGGNAKASSDPSPGCGGGGSWALANTVYDSGAPTSAPSSPASGAGAVQLVYDTIENPTQFCAWDTAESPIYRCSFYVTFAPIILRNLPQLATAPDNTPVYLEAWGASGGIGKKSGSANTPGGTGGYARTVVPLDQVLTPYLYLGNAGTTGGAPAAGRGGTATLVSTTDLPNIGAPGSAEDPTSAALLLIAGGGGGSGSGNTASSGSRGGAGGAAVAAVGAAASCGGSDGAPVQSSSGQTTAGGGGGNGGGGICDGSRTGTGGLAGLPQNPCGCPNASDASCDGCSNPAPGSAGLGGLGKPDSTNATTAGWIGTGTLSWTAGNGGIPLTDAGYLDGGGGGGGFGGGGGGNFPFLDGGTTGGGGGGSYAAAAVSETGAPLGANTRPNGNNGAVVLSFDLCSVEPSAFTECQN